MPTPPVDTHTSPSLVSPKPEGGTVSYGPMTDVEHRWVSTRDEYTFMRHGWQPSRYSPVALGDDVYVLMSRTHERAAEHYPQVSQAAHQNDN